MNVFNRAAVVSGMCLVVAGAAGLGGCSTNPTTGRKQLTFGGLSRDQEVAVGLSEGPKLTQEYGGEVANPLLRGYIDEVGQKLKNQTEVDGPTRKWTYTLLESDVINAFALPGERVFMSRGLADKLTTEAQLAGVLGHETGHVMARHTSERMAQANAVGIGSAIVGAVAGAATKNDTLKAGIPTVVSASGQVFELKFSRDQESEADSLGMRYMTKAGYNPHGQLEVMQVLQKEAGSGSTPEILATHPLPATRIDRVSNELKTTYANTQVAAAAASYGDFADRYRQRYLSLRELEPKGAAKAKKKAEGAPAVDEKGRTRLLAGVVAMDGDVVVADPMTWCSVCRANAVMLAK